MTAVRVAQVVDIVQRLSNCYVQLGEKLVEWRILLVQAAVLGKFAELLAALETCTPNLCWSRIETEGQSYRNHMSAT